MSVEYYQQVVQTQIIPRCQAMLNTLRDNLIAAGGMPNKIIVSMPDTTDLRLQIVAERGNRTLIGYIELSDATHVGGAPGHAVITLWLDLNGTEVTHSYVPGVAQGYITQEGLDALLAKLTELESKMPEITVKARAALGL